MAFGFAGGAVAGGGRLVTAMRGITAAGTGAGVAQGGYNIATGQGTAWDAVAILPGVAYGLGAIRRACFVGDTQVIVDRSLRSESQVVVMSPELIETENSRPFMVLAAAMVPIGIAGKLVLDDRRKRSNGVTGRIPRTPELDSDDVNRLELVQPSDLESSLPKLSALELDELMQQLLMESDHRPQSAVSSRAEMCRFSQVTDHSEPSESSGSAASKLLTGCAEQSSGNSPRSTEVQQPESTNGRGWLFGFLMLATMFLGLKNWELQPQPERFRQPTTAPVSASAEYITRSIRDVRVGQRVLAENPELNASDRQQAVEPDPATWKQVSLLLADADGLKVEIELLRSPDWLAENRVEPGGVIQLDLEELGASGEARVLAVSDCPLIEQGSGQVVTGTFAHQATEVLDLLIDGQAAPIGTTPNHPFWSNDRQRFVAAGDLRPGESLRTADGSQQTVRSVTSRGGGHTVYNLEVNREHVYYVGDTGLLVHNSKLSQAKNLLSRLWKDEVGSIDFFGKLGSHAPGGIASGDNITVLGRYMSRVDNAADQMRSLGAHVNTYKWRKYKGAGGLAGEQLADAQRLNREWLKRRIKSGDRIYDIGVPDGSADLGDFYSEELMHVGENLTPVYRGKFDIGNEIVDLWEWVLK